MSIVNRFFDMVESVVDGLFNMIGVHDIEDVSDFEEDTSDFEEVSGTLRPSTRDKADKDSTNLYIGKTMDDGNIKCQVVGIHDTNIHVKILEIHWERLGTYLDVGKTYPVFKHSSQYLGDSMQVWEISSKRMKRDTSQVLLYWEKGIGWSWDLDS